MKRRDLAEQLGLTVPDLNRELIAAGYENLVGATFLSDDVTNDIKNRFKQATTESEPTPEPQQPEQPTPPTPQQPAPGMGGALAETQSEQLTESRQKIEAILPDLDKILLQKTAQSAVADADLNALVYQSVFDSRSTDNRLAFVQQKIGQLNHQQAAKLDSFDPYQTLEDLGVTNPAQTYAAFCEYKRGLEAPKNAQSVPVDALGKQGNQARLEQLKAIYTGN